jgi:hypothetical protein
MLDSTDTDTVTRTYSVRTNCRSLAIIPFLGALKTKTWVANRIKINKMTTLMVDENHCG